MEFCDVEPLKILRHSTTRWLSLEKTVNRTLHHWSSLTSYFKSHEDVEKDGKVKKLAAYFSRPEVHMYFLFLQYILAPLNEFNTTFQVISHFYWPNIFFLYLIVYFFLCNSIHCIYSFTNFRVMLL